MCEYIELQRNEREYMLLKVSEEFIENYFPELNHSQPCPDCKRGRLYRQAIEEVKIYICDTCPAVEVGFHRECDNEKAMKKALDFFMDL